MFEIVKITEEQCLGWIISHPKLAEVSFSMNNYRFDKNQSEYCALINEYDIVGVVKYERFCEYGMQIHPYLNPEYWHSNFLFMCYNTIEDFFKKHGLKSLITLCPEDASHAIKASKKVGFQIIGKIKKAVAWKGRLNNLIMLQKDFE